MVDAAGGGGGIGLAALVIGFFVVRTRGIYFIMVTMAFAQMVFFLFFDNKALGGSDGLYINFKPAAGLFDLENKRVFYYFTLALLVLVYLFLRRLLFSPFGRALAGIRVNEHRMRAMGFGTFGYKLAAFTLAGALAGLAGYLWGAQTGFINPELMGFHMSAHAIMMVILGGMGNFAGAIVGVRLRVPAARVQGPARDRRLQHRQALAAVDGLFIVCGGGLRAARTARAAGTRAAPQGAAR